MNKSPNRRNFIKTIGLGAASLALPRWAVSDIRVSGKPNIIFIFIDDLGWKDVGFMGSTYYETPNIDKLAAAGMVFTNAYSNAPNCAPTRACLMSGQYSPRHGVYTVGSPERGKAYLRKLIPVPNKTTLDAGVVTIAESLKGAGYVSACLGKWHLGNYRKHSGPLSHGFDIEFHRKHRSHFSPQGEYLTDRLTDEAIRFIMANKDKPFFLYLSHHAVHTPIQAKQEIIEKYKRKKAGTGQNNPVYAAMIESTDRGIGQIIDNIDKLGLTENTVIFFFSDNGGYGPVTSMAPLRGAKGMLYEGGIRVPMFVCQPGRVKPGSLCEVPVIGIDFYPTILEMASVAKPSGHVLDGESMVPLLRQTGDLKRKAIFWHFPAYLEAYRGGKSTGPWRTTPAGVVRQGDWKLIEFFEDGRLELYNLKEDIGEKNNLARTMPEKTRQLHQVLIQWRRSVNAPVPTEKNPRYRPEPRPAEGKIKGQKK